MTTEVIFGKGTVDRVGEMVRKYGGTKALVIMDAGDFIKKSGLFDRVVNSLAAAGVGYVELEGVSPNPRLSLVYKGIGLAKKENCDFFLAVGGGSTCDTTKAISEGVVYDGDVLDFFTKKATPTKIAKMGAISTMAGTGAECSNAAIIHDDIHSHKKCGQITKDMRSLFAILDPELTYSLPRFQTAAGACDILAHPFDVYFTHNASYLGDRFCEAAMRTSVKYAPIALKEPSNYEARAELQVASCFGQNDTCRIGRNIRDPYTGGGHNLERQMTGYLDTPHGAGLAVIMPAFLEYLLANKQDTVAKIAQFAVNVFDVQADPLDPEGVAREGIKRFRAWLVELGLPQTIHELAKRELTDDEIEYLIGEVRYREDGCMQGFGNCTREDVRAIYNSCR